MNKYLKDWVKSIKTAKTDKELSKIVDRIYEQGFEDGINEVTDEDKAATVPETNARTLRNLQVAADKKSYFAGKYMFYDNNLDIVNNVKGRTHNGEGFPNSRNIHLAYGSDGGVS